MSGKINLNNFVDGELPQKLIQDLKYLLIELGHIQPQPRVIPNRIPRPIKRKLRNIPSKKWCRPAGSIDTLKNESLNYL